MKEFIVSVFSGVFATVIVLFGLFIMLWPLWVALAAFSYLIG